MIDDPNNPLGAATWMRGMWLGMALAGLFAVGAGLIFLLATLIGWEWKGALLISLCAGPFIGIGIFYVYWIVKRPQLSTIEAPPPPEHRKVAGLNQNQHSEAKTVIDSEEE